MDTLNKQMIDNVGQIALDKQALINLYNHHKKLIETELENDLIGDTV
jgi:hypothetical protein